MQTIKLAYLFAVLATMGCSSGGSGDDGTSAGVSGSTCAELAQTWCARACECTGGRECTLLRGSSATETHNTEQECSTFYSVVGCQSATSEPTVIEGCRSALAAGQCAPNGEGFEFPSACSDHF